MPYLVSNGKIVKANGKIVLGNRISLPGIILITYYDNTEIGILKSTDGGNNFIKDASIEYTSEYFTTISYDANIKKFLVGTSSGSVYFYDINNGFESSISVAPTSISDIKASGSVRVAVDGINGNVFPF
ncbi:MAG TPA: hypothetical protein P5513_07355 [Candidatus Diapherotrites archaeon]|nr:hypothetical protein [Candidatus Diapherotrites archaeon]